MRRAIKVLYLHTSLANKGPTRQLLYLVKALQNDSDLTIHTLVAEGKSSLAHLFSDGPLKLVTPEGSLVVHLIKLLKALRLDDYDVVHTAGFLPDLLAYLLCPRKKWVSVARNYPPGDYPKKFGPILGSVLARVQLFLHSRCRHQVVCSSALSDQLKRHNIHSKVIRNSVSVAGQPFAKKALRRPLRYLILGSVSQRKRVDLAIDVYLQLRQQGDCLFVVGDGPLKEALGAKCLAYTDIEFTGHVEDVRSHLAEADVLVSMSSSEGLPNAVLEALVTGLFCVLSDIQPHFELQRLIGMGVLTISAGDRSKTIQNKLEMRELAATIRELPGDFPLRVAARAREVFSSGKMAELYVGVYRDIGSQTC